MRLAAGRSEGHSTPSVEAHFRQPNRDMLFVAREAYYMLVGGQGLWLGVLNIRVTTILCSFSRQAFPQLWLLW